MSKSKWVVNVKGSCGGIAFEISVVRDDNEHGKSSYGWFDEDKLLITHSGGSCGLPLVKTVWDKQIALANSVADELNAELLIK